MRTLLIVAVALVAGCQGSQAPSSTPAAPVAREATVAPATVAATPEPGSMPVNIDNFGRAASDIAFAR